MMTAFIVVSSVLNAFLAFEVLAGTKAELQIIGSGFGRTGTNSLRLALNALGYKTYHMKTILEGQLSDHNLVWKAAAETNCSNIEDIKSLFEDSEYTAAVGFPTSMCWEVLMEAYPEAKVIHTECDSAEKWYDSASNTVFVAHKLFPFNILCRVAPFFISMNLMRNAMWNGMLKKRVSFDDDSFPTKYKKDLIEVYSANNERVKILVPPNRLLVLNHTDGWNMLCPFLAKDVPELPYPNSNKREEAKLSLRKFALLVFGAKIVAGMAVLFGAMWVLRRGRHFPNRVKKA